MANLFVEESSPQPPRVIKSRVEIHAILRILLDNHTHLTLAFADRGQRFQSFVVEVNREHNLLALDELIPNDGERFLQNTEHYTVEAIHDGVRISWECQQKAYFAELDEARCYWFQMPEEILYFQRRNAYRARVGQGQPVAVELSGDKLAVPLSGNLMDISASGCKIRLLGDSSAQVQPGQVFSNLSLQLPFGTISLSVEVRHQRFDEKAGFSLAGLRFLQNNGSAQRSIERFVYQLQREARRFEKDELL